MIEKIDIKELQGDVNLILFDYFNCGITQLKVSNEYCENIGGALNEIINSINIML